LVLHHLGHRKKSVKLIEKSTRQSIGSVKIWKIDNVSRGSKRRNTDNSYPANTGPAAWGMGTAMRWVARLASRAGCDSIAVSTV
jgi:hypothetical protein